MSSSALLTPGSNKINGAYLPTGPAPTHPYVENPFQEDVDGGDYNLTGLVRLGVDEIAPNLNDYVSCVQPLAITATGTTPTTAPAAGVVLMPEGIVDLTNGSIILDAKTGIIASETNPDTLELVAVNGATVQITDKSNSGQVYDTYFNKPVFGGVIKNIALPGIEYPVGSTSVSATAVNVALTAGTSYFVSGEILFSRYGYASGSAGNYSVPTPFSVRLQIRWAGVSGIAVNSQLFIAVPIGTINYPSNPLSSDDAILSFTGDTGPCPAGATGVYLYAYGNDNTVSFETQEVGVDFFAIN